MHFLQTNLYVNEQTNQPTNKHDGLQYLPAEVIKMRIVDNEVRTTKRDQRNAIEIRLKISLAVCGPKFIKLITGKTAVCNSIF